MAAYAALVSLMHIIEQIQQHPHPPISLNQKQVQSLTKIVTFLNEFLEDYSHVAYSNEADALENRIAKAAYAAEDVIECHIVDRIRGSSSSNFLTSLKAAFRWESINFYYRLQKVIEDMDIVKHQIMEIKAKMGIQNENSIPTTSLRSSPKGQSTMVGFDDESIEIMDKLTGGQRGRLVIPVIGMGGIGKTTLAKNVYENLLIVQHFTRRAWATISLEYSMRRILLEMLYCLDSRENLSQASEFELGDKLYKILWGRRYLVIMDDVWSMEVWEKLMFFFPDNDNGSRIVVTTRLSNLVQITGSQCLKMGFLDQDKSWNLLSSTVFGEEDCPPELEKVGKKIAENCKGLPLSLVVIGGLLATSEQTQRFWEYISENLKSIVSSEDDGHCLQIMDASYKQLPVHLKPCFLYMGVFPEDSEIRVSELIKLWVSEGFLRQIGGKSMKIVAREYLKGLIDRNLILIHKLGSNGKIKICKIHDVLRDLCLRESQKQDFLCALNANCVNIAQGIDTKRRIGIHQSTLEKGCLTQIFHSLQSASLVRSLICDIEEVLPPLDLKVLRVLKAADKKPYAGSRNSLEAIPELVNLRFLALEVDYYQFPIPSSISLFWNLQTLIFRGTLEAIAPSEIWNMTQLRHIECRRLYLPHPPSGHIAMENLETLLRIINFKLTQEVVERIPNIHKLQISYEVFDGWSDYCLNNLSLLHELESLGCVFVFANQPLHNISFPRSLKKLTLGGCNLDWREITAKIGWLPVLEVLKLRGRSFVGPEWETVEGQFCSLKFLLIDFCDDLECWNTDSTHFPCLEHLRLRHLSKLNEIPLSIGDIPTLQSIELYYCSNSSVNSAREILEDQEKWGNDGLKVHVFP